MIEHAENNDTLCRHCGKRRGKHRRGSLACPNPLFVSKRYVSRFSMLSSFAPVNVPNPCPTCGHKTPRTIKVGDMVEHRETKRLYVITGVTASALGGRSLFSRPIGLNIPPSHFSPGDVNLVKGYFRIEERIEP